MIQTLTTKVGAVTALLVSRQNSNVGLPFLKQQILVFVSCQIRALQGVRCICSEGQTTTIEDWEGESMADQMQEATSELVTASGIDMTQLDRTFLRPSPDVQGTTMDGETVLLDLSSGRYYTLNRLGSVIWEQCIGRQTICAIHAALCERFEVGSEQALDDLVALANELIQEGLLQQERR